MLLYLRDHICTCAGYVRGPRVELPGLLQVHIPVIIVTRFNRKLQKVFVLKISLQDLVYRQSV